MTILCAFIIVAATLGGFVLGVLTCLLHAAHAKKPPTFQMHVAFLKDTKQILEWDIDEIKFWQEQAGAPHRKEWAESLWCQMDNLRVLAAERVIEIGQVEKVIHQAWNCHRSCGGVEVAWEPERLRRLRRESYWCSYVRRFRYASSLIVALSQLQAQNAARIKVLEQHLQQCTKAVDN